MTTDLHRTLAVLDQWIKRPITEAPTYLSVDENVEENQEDEGNDAVDKQVEVNEINLDI